MQTIPDSLCYLNGAYGALADVEQAGILGRAWDSIRLWIK